MPSNVSSVLRILKKEHPHAKYYLHFKTPMDLLVAASLSPQVRDEVVNDATKTLFKEYRKASDYANATEQGLLKHVSKVSFAKQKVKRIIAACKILDNEHKGKVPKDVNSLIALPGIGRKTANAILAQAYGIIEGIPVDTHVLRLSYRLGWTTHKNADKVEKDLIGIIPKKDWDKIPYLLKDHGRAVCKALTPICSACKLEKYCPKKGVTKSK